MRNGLPPQLASVDSLLEWLGTWVAQNFKIDPQGISPGDAFLNFGMDSVQAMTLVGDLESELRLRLSPTLVWDYPTVGELANHLGAQLAGGGTTESQPEAAENRETDLSVLQRLGSLNDQDVDKLLNQYLGGKH